MVWGAFTAHHRTQLVIIHGHLTGVRYRDEIVWQHTEPFMRTHGPGVILQQDNAHPHIASVVEAELQRARIDTLPWPANSPDMAPIEHAKDELHRRVDHLHRAPTTLPEHELVLVQEWQNIPQGFL